ncbi:MAG: DUF2489 domain-containing protein [Desulfuromonadales bacterium]|nr:DUF2489 domain-containing protein [Desulfuromonadales bacterium]
MQNSQDYQSAKRSELITIASSMIDGNLHLIEGVRKVCSLRHSIGQPESELFLLFRAVDSETDHYPLGDARQHFADDYLHKLDAEMSEYLADTKEEILSACRTIIQIFSETSQGK